MPNVPSELEIAVKRLVGKECWNVAEGNGTGASFSAAFGAKTRRLSPLKNPRLSAAYREWGAELILMVWCTWRIDREAEPIASSDDDVDARSRGLGLLLGKNVVCGAITSPAWDLKLEFDLGTVMTVFCDHLPGNPSFDGNWHIEIEDRVVFAGPGAHWGVEPR